MEKRNNSRMGPLEETLSKSKIEPTGQREIYRFKPKTAVTNDQKYNLVQSLRLTVKRNDNLKTDINYKIVYSRKMQRSILESAKRIQ